MSALEKMMLKVHERLRATGEAPRYMAAEGEEVPLPPQLRGNRKHVKRVVGRHTYTDYKE